MKIIFISLLLLFISGCASTGNVNNADPQVKSVGSTKNTLDTERQEDVTLISKALNLYISKNGIPDNLKSIATCNDKKTPIGTSPEFIDLSYLTPDYIDTIPLDPVTGEEARTGYAICLNNKNAYVIWALNTEEVEQINAGNR